MGTEPPLAQLSMARRSQEYRRWMAPMQPSQHSKRNRSLRDSATLSSPDLPEITFATYESSWPIDNRLEEARNALFQHRDLFRRARALSCRFQPLQRFFHRLMRQAKTSIVHGNHPLRA